MIEYIRLGYLDLALAGSLVLLNGALSMALGLGIERRLFVAAARMIVQLSLVGLVLATLFALVSPLWTGLAALAMVLFAGREIMARQERRLTGPWAYGLGTGCMLVAALAVTVFALTTAVRPDPWYHPRYALPLLGMILGNTMTGISLGLDALTAGAVRERLAVEAQLALGATRFEAMLPVARRALRGALMPIINSMAAIGIVSLPGMMTGQILAGVEPDQAVRYQLLIMFLIAGGTGLGAVAAVTGGVLRLTDGRHRLRLDRLAGPGAEGR
ncbi:MAG TPA: ABC transporter permease [Geminicoccaceae bacterium]|nr:ABC transporter permease [Geminicoccaceae bacterium]